MAEVETNTLVKAIISIVVLVVIALVIYSVMNFDDVSQIAKEVFHVESQAEINTKTEESADNFVSGLDSCNNGEYNPLGKDNCFCFQKNHGYMQEDSYITIQNSDSSSTLTVLTENGEPLAQYKKPYSLGLMATSGSGDDYQLGCTFPTQYFIIADGTEWYVRWNNEILDDYIPFDDDYTFGFYRDDTSSTLASAPMLYRLDSTHYCLVTKLIDEQVGFSSQEFTSFGAELQRIGDDPRVFNEPESTISNDEKGYYSSVQTFLLNEELYCNKL
jgi:uncharacterized protein YxeA